MTKSLDKIDLIEEAMRRGIPANTLATMAKRLETKERLWTVLQGFPVIDRRRQEFIDRFIDSVVSGKEEEFKS